MGTIFLTIYFLPIRTMRSVLYDLSFYSLHVKYPQIDILHKSVSRFILKVFLVFFTISISQVCNFDVLFVLISLR